MRNSWDSGGKTFVKGIRNRLYRLNYKGVLFVVEMNGAKDPNELHKCSPTFKKDFEHLISEAKPILLAKSTNKIEYGSLIPELPEPKDVTVLQLMKKSVGKKKNFALIAPQGSGKSYANADTAVSELRKGRSTIIFSRSHDELHQLGKTIKSRLIKTGLSESHLFHMKGGYRGKKSEGLQTNQVPELRPIIVIAPHAYLGFKGETPYHYTLTEMIFSKAFGELPLVLIDEVVSYLAESFLSKPLGSRNTLKKVFGEEFWIRNTLCPLFNKSGNCLKCYENKLLQPRRVSGGMLNYVPVAQYHKDDHLKSEEVDLNQLGKIVFSHNDNTMQVCKIMHSKTTRERQWSTGRKDDLQLEISFKYWSKDILGRLISPSIVYFYPYDCENRKNIGRPLAGEELDLKKKGYRIISPRNVCGIPRFQGWDLAVLRRIGKIAQVGFTGPGASEADRYVLQDALGSIQYYSARFPYVRFQNLLIITLDKDIPFHTKEARNLMVSLTQKTKVLSFLPTYHEAEMAEKALSEEVQTIFYNGAQKIRHAPIKGTSIEFDLCISCIHGPLAQGLDLGQFKIAMISTNTERPKCLFVGRPDTKSNKEYIEEDVAEKCRQGALRILRLTENEQATAPRVFVFYGRHAEEVGDNVRTELAKVGHTVKSIHAQACLRYAKELSLRWVGRYDISELEKMGVSKYEEKMIVGEARESILEYLKRDPNARWREVVSGPRTVRELPASYKALVKQWFEEHIAEKNQNVKFQRLVEKIQKYLQLNPETRFSEIRRKFNLHRLSQEERDGVRKLFASNML